MKTNRSKRFAGLIIALAVATTTAFAGNNPGRTNNRGICINQISNLTVGQKEKISTLQTEHQKTMDQLRQNRRNTTDWSVKNQISEEMNSENQKYRNELNSVLTPEQQTQFLSSNQGKGKRQAQVKGSCGKPCGNSNGSGKGQGSGACRQF
jgi:Spy/CpxP family protein refolding chaperone